MPDSATSPPAPDNATAMETDRSVHVVRAKNATAPSIVEMEHEQSPSNVAQPSPVIYHSTGINTQPALRGNTFEAIYGHKPTMGEIETVCGLRGIGRYTSEGEVKPHELVYGAPFPATKKTTSDYVDSGFQTIGPKGSKMALTRAKAKASMMANQYRQVAEDLGIKLITESNDDKVVHSEQFSANVEFDEKGKFKSGSTRLLLQNISGADIEPIPVAKSKSMTRKTKSIARVAKDLVTTFPIAALAPSHRPFDRILLPIEDYGNEAPQYKSSGVHLSSDESYEDLPATADERSDWVDPVEFVIHDATRVASSHQPDKRKRSNGGNDKLDSYQSKRAKVSHAHNTEVEAQFQSPPKEPRDASNTPDATTQTKAKEPEVKVSPEPKPKSRIVDALSGPKADRARYTESKHNNGRDDTRSRHRSRSPQRETKNSHSASKDSYRDRGYRERAQLQRKGKSPDRRESSNSAGREFTSSGQYKSSREDSAKKSGAETAAQVQKQRQRRSDSGYDTRNYADSSPMNAEKIAHPPKADLQAQKKEDLRREHQHTQKRSFDIVDQLASTNKNVQTRGEVNTKRPIAAPRSRRPARPEQMRYKPPTARDLKSEIPTGPRDGSGYEKTQSEVRDGPRTDYGDERRKKRRY